MVRVIRPTTAPCLRVFKIKADSRMECLDNAALKKKQEEDLDREKHLIFARAYHPDKELVHKTERPAHIQTTTEVVANGARERQILQKEMALWF